MTCYQEGGICDFGNAARFLIETDICANNSLSASRFDNLLFHRRTYVMAPERRIFWGKMLFELFNVVFRLDIVRGVETKAIILQRPRE